MNHRAPWIRCIGLSLTLLGTAASHAQGLPAVDFGTAPLVSPTAAAAYYTLPATHTTQRPPEVQELANGLGAAQVRAGTLAQAAYASRVFEYVRQNIRTVFMYGVQKGSIGAVLDQAGTSFDQASLMVDLLREANITAQYQLGTLSLPAAQFTAWTGISDATAACRLMADGGTPAVVTTTAALDAACTLSGSTSVGALSNVTLSHLWVLALGTAYDPAYKISTFKQPLAALDQRLGCTSTAVATGVTCATTAVSKLTTGATTSTLNGATFYQTLKQATLETQLNTYASTLATYLKGNLPNALLEDVAGGSRIDLTTLPIPAATNPKATGSIVTWTDIPDQYRTTLAVTYDGTTTTLFVNDIYGKRLRLIGIMGPGTGTATRKVTLYLEYQILATTNNAAGTPANSIVTLAVNHPYAANSGAYMDKTTSNAYVGQIMQPVASAFTFMPTTIVYSSGYTGRQLVANADAQKNADELALNIPDPGNANHTWTTSCPSSPVNQCLQNHQAVLVATYFTQLSKTVDVVERLNNSSVLQHHEVGFAESSGFFSGMVMSVVSGESVITRTNVAADRQAAIGSMAVLASRLEGSIFEQTQDAWDGLSSVSLLARANQQNYQLILVDTAARLTSVQPQLVGYNASLITRLQSYLSSGYQLVLPRTWDVGSFAATNGTMVIGGGGYLAFKPDSSSLGYIAGMEDKGAAGPTAADPAAATSKSVQLSDYSTKSTKYYGVSLANGTLTLTPPPDLETGTGGFPYSLALSRTYSSAADPDLHNWAGTASIPPPGYGTRMDLGWENNFQIMADVGSDAEQALGEDSALDAVSTIAALQTLRGLSFGTLTFPTRLATVFTSHWWANTLINNRVVVKRPPASDAFVRLPDGSFNPPPGSAETLTQAGTRLGPYTTLSGVVFNYAPITFGLQGKDGSNLAFTLMAVTSQILTNGHDLGRRTFAPNTWTFPSGVIVTFSYQTQPGSTTSTTLCLKGVSNNLGRQLNFSFNGQNLGFDSCTISSVADENGRTVQYTPAGNPSARMLYTTYAVTGPAPDNAKTIYTYGYPAFVVHPAAGGNMEYNTTTAPRFRHVLLNWTPPTDAVNPYLTVTYDPMLRVSRMTRAPLTGGVNPYVDYRIGSMSTETLRRGDSLSRLGASNTEYFDYFSKGVQSIDPLGKLTARVYDAQERLSKETLPEGNATEYTYDVRSNVTQILARPKSGSPLSPTTVKESFLTTCTVAQAPICNRPQTHTDANTNATTFGWDPTTGLLTSIQSPAVTAGTPLTTLGYTKFGPAGQQFSLLTTKTQRVTTTPAQNLVTTYGYNVSNKFVLQNAVVDSGGLNLTTSFTFDAVGNVTQIDGPRSDVTDITGYQFDTTRRLKEVDGQLGAVTKYTYDLDGLLTQTQRAINSAGTLWQTEKRTYWPSGDLRTTQSPNATGATDFMTRYDYDADGRLTTVTSPISASVTRLTSYQFDLAGHKLVEIRGAGAPGQITYGQWGYTDNGKLQFSEDGNGNRSGYSYDGLDRLAQMFLPSPTVHVPSTTIFEKYDYDANGSLKTKTNRSGKTVTFTYDALDRETQRVLAANAGAHFARTLTSTYDLLGSKLVLTADGQTLTHAYDTAERLKSVTDSAIGMVSYLRDPAGNRTQVKWPDGYFVAYGYDALNRMTSVSENGTTSIAAYSLGPLFRNSVTFGNSATTTWQFYNDGALSSLTNVAGSKSVGFSLQRNQLDQLTQQSVSVTDPAAQLVPRSFLSVPVAAASASYVPNFLDQYTSVASVAKTYDANGNLASDGTNAYEYDEENRLRTVGTAITYEYDPLGRRRAKTVSGTTTKFLADGDEEIGEYSGSTLLRRYVYGVGIDERLAQVEASGTRTYFQTNHQGSTVLTSDATATVTAYNYGPFGESTSPGTGVAFRYTGRRYDSETGLYYYRARYYSPALGRFLQTDPVGYQDDLNLYAYVGNDPLNKSDPTGLDAESEAARKIVEQAAKKIAQSAITAENASTALAVARVATPVGAALVLRGDTPQDKLVNATYTKTNPETGTVYSGRTSIVVPRNVSDRAAGLAAVAQRDAGHHMSAQGFGPAVLDKASQNSIAIRGREQQLIDFNGGAKSVGGTSGNAINGIADGNPFRPIYMNSAVAEFGGLPDNSPPR